jgi:GNAT superfamily N-acetyltransferase
VSQEARRQGVARALIEWMTQDAKAHGATRLHWHTTQDNTNARAFYDTVGRFKGFITYTRPLGEDPNPAQS